jgi:hypothetical protein
MTWIFIGLALLALVAMAWLFCEIIVDGIGAMDDFGGPDDE